MPTIRRKVSAASENILEGLKFSVQGGPALVSLFASSATASESLSFSVNNTDIVVDATINLESGNEVVDPQRDGILINERVPEGKYYLRIPTVAADMSFLLLIDPVG